MNSFNDMKTCVKMTNSKRLQNPSGERNKAPILEKLKMYIDSRSPRTFLEISSGTGLHVNYFASAFPNINFQPTEYNENLLPSIREFAMDFPENILEPLAVDISRPFEELDPMIQNKNFDYMININLMHISPIQCTYGLFSNAARLLKPEGMLFTYGPYACNGILEPESNVRFNEMLKNDNPEWGIRDLMDLENIAMKNQIKLVKVHDLEANNKFVVWQKY